MMIEVTVLRFACWFEMSLLRCALQEGLRNSGFGCRWKRIFTEVVKWIRQKTSSFKAFKFAEPPSVCVITYVWYLQLDMRSRYCGIKVTPSQFGGQWALTEERNNRTQCQSRSAVIIEKREPQECDCVLKGSVPISNVQPSYQQDMSPFLFNHVTESGRNVS